MNKKNSSTDKSQFSFFHIQELGNQATIVTMHVKDSWL